MSARLLLSCGEASGDLYAGALVRELRTLDPSIAVRGLGGPEFRAAGGQLVEDYRGMAVTGLTEAIAKLPRSLAVLRRLAVSAARDPVDAFVAIDFPDFNFPLARRMRRLGVPVIYYISPQIWAWRANRMKSIRAFASRVLVIFPFEESLYRTAGVPVEFVGHPLIDLVRVTAPRDAFLTRLGLSSAAPTIAMLPGSRPNEVERILPTLVEAAGLIRHQVPGAQFVVARAPHLEDRLFEVCGGAMSVVLSDTDTVLASADLALTASGTATVQAALHDTPMVIVYRTAPLTYSIVRSLVTVRYAGMVNLIAGELVVPELIQDAFTARRVADEAISLLTDRGRAARVREGLARVRKRLGGPGASRRAAEAVLKVVGVHA